jgi:hypothetical protein
VSQSPKLAIPALMPGDPAALYAIKNQLEIMNGTLGGRLSTLSSVSSTATLAQTVTALNEAIAAINLIIGRLNA